MRCDAVIFGGGVAGLWLLDRLRSKGCSALLLEAASLGSGQTVASQGIIHGGLKYTLQGLLTKSAASIREMPALWRDCLAGRGKPDLSATRIRSDFCFLWRTESFKSRLGMIGAKVGLRVAPQTLRRDELPDVLAACPGSVARLDEQVIAPASLIAALAAPHRAAILQYDARSGIDFAISSNGNVTRVTLAGSSARRGDLILEPQHVIFTAGAGNAHLRALCGLDSAAMQRRPLHMLMVKGNLPELNGHCVDGSKTRVTITSDRTAAGEVVWQVGGQLAEDGVPLSRSQLITRGRAELAAVLPGIQLDELEWGSYRVDRAERAIAGGGRPDSFQWMREGNVVTAWPTKLVLAPLLADELAATIEPKIPQDAAPLDWPQPAVALPPWDIEAHWDEWDDASARRQSA